MHLKSYGVLTHLKSPFLRCLPSACLLCKTPSKKTPFLCEQCRKSKINVSPQSSWFKSLYLYNENLRLIILKAKLKRDYRAIFASTSLFFEHYQTPYYLNQYDYITPAPSSLWSRLRGNIDLAWILCFEVSQRYPVKVLPVKFSEMWKLKKQSVKKYRKKKQPIEKQSSNISKSCPKLLIIDDVVTSGETLINTAKFFPEYNIDFLTLANAYQKTNDQPSNN